MILDAEAIGRYESIPEADLFDIEYWSLEQAKLGKEAEKRSRARSSSSPAAPRASAPRPPRRSPRKAPRSRCSTATAPRSKGFALACDVTSRRDVRAAFDTIAATFGGVDIVVSNAGAAWQGRIGEVDDATLRDSFELNFFAHQSVAQNAVRIMRAQGTGGCLLFNVSKQAVNPGPDFGPYGLPKAATLFLVRQYALDHGKDGIRANAVNADRVRTGLLTDDMIASAPRRAA